MYKELNERRGGLRNSNHTEGWISMSGEGGQEIRPRVQGGQYPSRVSFVKENEDGIKVGGLVKRVCPCLRIVSLRLSDYFSDNYRENTRF